MTKGTIIVIEGIEGAGKSTLVSELLAKNSNLTTLRELSATPFNSNIVAKWVGEHDITKDALTAFKALQYLMLARTEAIEKVILPQVNNGINVLLDRFALSTVVYQNFNASWGHTHLIKEYLKYFSQLIDISATVFLQISPKVAYDRVHSRAASGGDFDPNDAKPLDHFQLLDSKYKAALNSKLIPSNLIGKRIYLDAELPLEEKVAFLTQTIHKLSCS